MTAELINLRQRRKQAARAERAGVAAVNRANFGEAKAAKTLREKGEALAAAKLDALKREP